MALSLAKRGHSICARDNWEAMIPDVKIGRLDDCIDGEFREPKREVFVCFHSANTSLFDAMACCVPAGSSNERHAHEDSDEIIYVIHGQMVIEIEGTEYTLNPGDAVLVQRTWQHQVFNRCSTDLLHTFTFNKTEPVDAIANGYGNPDNYFLHPRP